MYLFFLGGETDFFFFCRVLFIVSTVVLALLWRREKKMALRDDREVVGEGKEFGGYV